MTAPETRTGGLDANVRGILVLVVAAAVGALLLWQAKPGGGATKVVAGKSTTTTTVDTSTLGTGTTTSNPLGTPLTTGSTASTSTSKPAGGGAHAPAEVNVVVLNGTGPVGSAASTSKAVQARGYQTGAASNATVKPTATVVYYAPNYQPDAMAVAALLGKGPNVVQPKPSAAPGPGADKANVVVVLGKDTAPVGGGTTSTSTAAGGTTASTG
ncbi:MAG: LytR C-terminal domain-containing protein [Acidimicrobiales bacterium]